MSETKVARAIFDTHQTSAACAGVCACDRTHQMEKTACAVAIVHRNHFFHLHQQNKSSESEVKFRQASNRCEKVLEAAKRAYANKTKESITSQKRGSRDFW